MATDAAVLELVRRAFSRCPKPEHFTNYRHCPECADHDRVLRLRDVDSLSREDVGNWGWDPLFATPLPRGSRITSRRSPGWRFQHCTPEQRKAVAALLEHIAQTRRTLLAEEEAERLLAAIQLWSQE